MCAKGAYSDGSLMFRKYGKAAIAVLTAAVTVAYQAQSGDDHIDPVEWASIAIALVSAVGVYLVPMAPQAKWGKSAVAAVLAVLQVVSTGILAGGFGYDEVLLSLIAAAGAVGVFVAPAVSDGAGGVPAVAVGTGADS